MAILDKIIEAKNKIGDKAVPIIAEYLQLQDFNEVTKKALCPKHKEKTPSFVWDSKEQKFHCFGCGYNFSLLDMYIEQEGSYIKGVKKLCEFAEIDFDVKENTEEKTNTNFFENYVYPVEENGNDRTQVENYCALRGISQRTLDYMGIKSDKHNNVVFELRDLNNKLLAVKYRPARAVKKGEPKMWWQPKSSTCPSLYNKQRIDPEKPLVITEGFFDTLAIVEAGYKNVVSIDGGALDTKWIEFNYSFLEQFEEIILWYDNDEAGQNGLKEVVSRLGSYRCKIVKPSTDFEDIVETYYLLQGTKKKIRKTDANNILLSCGSEIVLNLIENAELVPNPLVKRLMDYDEVQLEDLPCISTGFKAMDKVLYGNFENSLVVLTGQAGASKSTILNIMYIAEPLESGEKVFVYSGELPPRILLGNILRPLASDRHVRMWDNGEDKPVGYTVTKRASEAIKKYYRDQLFVYDDGELLSSKRDSLLETMEDSYKRYGIKSFVLDNLMTLDMSGVSGENKVDTQIEFVKKLKTFTRLYPVKVLLVAHSRKMAAGSTEIKLDDISGASEVAKISDRCYAVEILRDDPEGYNTKITVLKDRQSGKAGQKIFLYYDPATLRIYSDKEELSKKYKWEREAVINYNEDISKNLVCNNRQSEISQNTDSAPF